MIPTPIYEMLPAAYVTAGALTIGSTDQVLAFASGALFTLAGVLVYQMRLDARDRRG